MHKPWLWFSRLLTMALFLSLPLAFSVPSLGQEGTITLLSAQDKLTLLYHDNLNANWLPLLQPSAQDGRSPLSAVVEQARANAQRLMTVYVGSAPAQMGASLDEIARLMNAGGYDLASFGAYELTQSEGELADAIMSARFPYLASNLELAGGSLAGLSWPFGTTTLEDLRAGNNGRRIYDGLLVDVVGVNVCFFGLIDPAVSYAYKTSDLSAAAQRLVETCRANQSELTVALLHRSPAASLERYDLSGVDVVIIGGADEVLNPQAGPSGNIQQVSSKSLWVQVAGQGRALGKLELSLTDGRISRFDHNLLELRAPLAGFQPQAVPAATSPWWIVAFAVGVVVAAVFFLARKP